MRVKKKIISCDFDINNGPNIKSKKNKIKTKMRINRPTVLHTSYVSNDSDAIISITS